MNKMLGGVAGGIARYLNADVTPVRVIIAALALFSPWSGDGRRVDRLQLAGAEVRDEYRAVGSSRHVPGE